MSVYINYNGQLLPSDQPLVSADNRGLRYGDGIFETMRMVNGRIPLWHLHAERLFKGLKQLLFELPALFTPDTILEEIKKLATKNSTQESSRVRLAVFRGEGGLYDPANHRPNYVIQSWEIEPFPASINENGLIIDIYPDAKKSCDGLANLKSNNFLPYTMAALYAKQNKLNDCLVLNSAERISDSIIANVFVVKATQIKTPPLSEGCIAGVTRRWLLEKSVGAGFQLKETEIGIEDLFDADEIFLTNAVQGIRWVKQFRNKTYSNQLSSQLYKVVYKNIFS